MGVAKYNWMREEMELRVKLKELSQQDRKELIDDLICRLCEDIRREDPYWVVFARGIEESITQALLQ
jgi:hypothetical protein